MSMRPEIAQSNFRLRIARSVFAKEIQSFEKGLYFFHREKCCAHGTRTGMKSSTTPWPSRKEASSSLTSSEIRAVGKERRRFAKNGTAIARSPRFQYST